MSIDPPLEKLISALRHHARVMSLSDVPLKEGTAAFEEVRAAVRSYSDAIFEVSGWGSPFTNVDEIEDDDLDDEADSDL
ncbi:hypothetical protein [Streptomyces fulvorobeus]|uniref:Uncharacterized protein n=1 Tax=Streptomyces fulvorobeus TaxID=284028 RepID=A0A7J0C3B0_9ACTN|nr:hypothetical protein [Streptomyces fulvorobeus]NYE40668.1 hypothetical protein [Streptomyces fulvorobeus]GFM96970.1 hypothetical protein Sfulv_17810 [Streptomyces fulvorobeus]